jgi:hypothetical protein
VRAPALHRAARRGVIIIISRCVGLVAAAGPWAPKFFPFSDSDCESSLSGLGSIMAGAVHAS